MHLTAFKRVSKHMRLVPKSHVLAHITPDRWRSKTLLTIDERGSKIARNSVFDSHLLPWQSKTMFLTIFI